jgi:hypothetical protein
MMGNHVGRFQAQRCCEEYPIHVVLYVPILPEKYRELRQHTLPSRRH